MFLIDFSLPTSQLTRLKSERTERQNAEAWEQDIWDFVSLFLKPGQEEFSINTSGSTGTPKVIKHSKEQLINSATATNAYFGLGIGTTALLALPVKQIGGRMMIVRAIVGRYKLLISAPSSNPFAALAEGQQVDFAPLTPMQLSNALKNSKTRNTAGQIKTIILGGGEIATELEDAIKKLSNKVYATYGMTETVSHVALRKVNGNDASNHFSALPGVQFDVNSNECLVISAPHLNIEALATNDVVELISPTEFVWKARYDNVVNSGGVKLYPEEIERKLTGRIPVPFFVTGEKDAVYGERLAIVIEGQIKASELGPIFDNALSKYEKPKVVYFSAGFSKTESGKIQRKESLEKAMLLSYL